MRACNKVASGAVPAAAVLIAGLAVAAPAAAADGAGASVSALYGSLETSASVLLDGDGRGEGGFRAENRWIFESEPEEGVSFRAEGGWRATYGAESEAAAAFAAGLAAPPGALPPGADLHREFFLDRAALSASLGPVDLDAGVVAPGWGSGYLFNPSDRTNRPAFPGEGTDATPGALGFVLRATLPAGLSAEAFALAQARVRSPLPDAAELRGERFPAGARLRLRSDALDASAGILRELPASDEEPSLWAVADAAGFAGPLSLYAEGALRLPGWGAAPEAADRNAGDELEACAGLSWTVPVAEIVLRAEGAWFGSGHEKPADYDAAGLLAGRRALLARRYLFAMAEKEDADAAAWKVGAGTLVNLDDGSAAFMAEAAWRPRASLEIAAWARAFAADDEAELGGRRQAGPASFRPYRPAAGLKVKLAY